MDYEKKRIPKKAFDSEYKTEFLREVKFLEEKGIKHTFIWKTKDYGISQYKYRKTPALFAALVEFYAIIEAEKAVRKQKNGGVVPKETILPKMSGEVVISPEQIKKAQEILEKAVQQNIIKTEATNIEAAEKDDTL